ncbi:MAG: sigma 54-interacting transcriptional regulator [Bdellovibrionales bacterium]|nr:sigma 54-interacting transcriptional regulator [Bdellovibrionales bacterium]
MIFLQVGKNQKTFENKINQNSYSKNQIDHIFIEKSSIMKLIYQKIKTLVQTEDNILIFGEKGTGRSFTAYQIFHQYNHENKRFTQIDCKTLTSQLIEKNLFEETYSNSYKPLLSSDKKSFIHIKNIEFLNSKLQKRLFNYLTDKKTNSSKPRLIFSSNENFSKKITEKVFSQKLFNLISENLIILPKLSERPEDILPLISLFNKKNNFQGKLSKKVESFLYSYPWYENVSELKKVCLKLSVLYPKKDIINEQDLSYVIKSISLENITIKYNPNLTLEDIVNHYMEQALLHFRCKKLCADALGISVKTLYNKIRKGIINDPHNSNNN